MKKQQLQQEIAELQKQLEEKQKALAAMPEKWEPKGGDWYVCGVSGEVISAASAYETRAFGVERATLEQAEKAAKAMRAHNRLLAYVADFAPDWEPNWSHEDCEAHCVKLVDGVYEYEHNVCKRIGTVYMPRYAAEELCDKLNSGEVEL